MRVQDLTQSHIGHEAVVDGRRGILSHGRVPGYGAHITAWFLITPCPLPQFAEQAVSLQWAGAEEVQLTGVRLCDRCDGKGVAHDATNADRVNPGPLANRCPTCEGRGKTDRATWTERAARWKSEPYVGPEWDDTQELPAWMCGEVDLTR